MYLGKYKEADKKGFYETVDLPVYFFHFLLNKTSHHYYNNRDVLEHVNWLRLIKLPKSERILENDRMIRETKIYLESDFCNYKQEDLSHCLKKFTEVELCLKPVSNMKNRCWTGYFVETFEEAKAYFKDFISHETIRFYDNYDDFYNSTINEAN